MLRRRPAVRSGYHAGTKRRRLAPTLNPSTGPTCRCCAPSGRNRGTIERTKYAYPHACRHFAPCPRRPPAFADVQTFDLDKGICSIAYRPVTGVLLGFSSDAIYKIDPATDALTDLGASFAEDAENATDAKVAFDFNNKIDAVCAVSSNGNYLVYFPEGFGNEDERANSFVRFSNLAHTDRDNSAGAEPLVFAKAYTNAIAGKTAGGTFQYALDARANALISIANNEGTLETIDLATVDGEPADITPWGGFDIVSPTEGQDNAYAILQIDGEDIAGLNTIDLGSGAATLLSDLGMGGFTGFADSQSM